MLSPHPPPSALPPGWEQRFDPATQRHYWYNVFTQQAQWTPPSSAVLPRGWEERIDPASGRRFWLDHSTHTTHWQPPNVAVAPAPIILHAHSTFCTHKTCAKIRSHGNPAGVACTVLNLYNQREWTILLGLEADGEYKHTYNLCAGKLEAEDHGCYLEAARRELLEEFAIETVLGKGQSFDRIFKNSLNRFRLIYYHGTPIFIGVFPNLSRNKMNPTLQWRKQQRVQKAFREIERVDWFSLRTHQQIEGEMAPVSSFAGGVMRLIDVNKLK